jgi:hypothetical protein
MVVVAGLFILTFCLVQFFCSLWLSGFDCYVLFASNSLEVNVMTAGRTRGNQWYRAP